MKEYEILDKDDGYWVIDDTGCAQGPYDSIKDCHDDIPPTADVQYPLGLLPTEDYL
tara:strand:+ start:454 stop:621 length:168 start_codon:yes stop_codon:yes gene_type:complete